MEGLCSDTEPKGKPDVGEVACRGKARGGWAGGSLGEGPGGGGDGTISLCMLPGDHPGNSGESRRPPKTAPRNVQGGDPSGLSGGNSKDQGVASRVECLGGGRSTRAEQSPSACISCVFYCLYLMMR